MKKSVLFGAGILATVLLAGCGGSSSGGSGVSSLSTKGLTPISGSDSIIGTWIGATDYVETISSEGGTGTYTGSRQVIVQIDSNGVGGYSLTDCENDTTSVILDAETSAVTALDRNFVMTDFNRMTGTSTKAEWGTEGQENWAWVKVSNTTDNIGSVEFSYLSSSLGGIDDSAEILSLCRESLAYSDTVGDSWTTIEDKGAYSYQNVTGGYEVRIDSDGWEEAEFDGALSISAHNYDNSATDTIELSVKNSAALDYEVTYTVAESAGDSLGATLKISIAQ